ncbi:MAG: hypothetical protein HYZ11_12830 [Candidatus Tectomicrobia bacterium]|uniref:Uncharacterized protein n=1 Tax=Tectimicrobiota bacterium TaxID=2528274 RepID=A0A932I0K8_UNCTE|nr:hypothetical protein [Candidatus Tectomicrobia bacterium]
MGGWKRPGGWAAAAALPLVFLLLDPGTRLDAPGWRVILHLLHLGMAGLAALVLCMAGKGVLLRAGLLPADPWERLLLAGGAGFALIAPLLLLLGAAGGLRAWLAWPLAALLAASGRGWHPREEGRKFPFPPPSTPARPAAWGLAILLALLFLGSLLEALQPVPQSPDPLAQTLAYPRLFAREGGMIFTPESPLYFALTGYWELFLSALAIFLPSDVSLAAVGQLLHLLLGLGGAALGVFCLVRRIAAGGPGERLALGLFGAALFAGMRADVHHVRLFSLLAVEAKSDLIVAALQMAGTLALLRALGEEKGRRRAFFLAGTLLGAAAGVKITAGLAVIGLGAAFLAWPPEPLARRERWRALGWAGAGLALLLIPLVAKNAIALGNPLYPLLSSRLGCCDNPLYYQLVSGLGAEQAGSWAGWALLRLAFPSLPFLLLLAGLLRPELPPRPARFLLLTCAFAALAAGLAFARNFPVRYALFIPAFTAAAAACAAGGLLAWMRTRRGTGELLASPIALGAGWMLLVALALAPTHLDNRLKRGFRAGWQEGRLRERMLAASPASRFQAGWAERLPAGAKLLTFYRPERLVAFTAGFRPAVAVEDPELAALVAREKDPARLERALAARGVTHVYFESRTLVPPGFPLDPAGLAGRLRGRPPLWREAGFEMHALEAVSSGVEKKPPGARE